MEYLRKEGTKRRVLLSKNGNEVLRLSHPLITGDTPAARHVAALIEALVGYAEGEALRVATEALSAAVKGGRPFDFTPHTYDVSLDLERREKHVTITLLVEFKSGTAPIFSRRCVQHWDKSEQLQLPRAGHGMRQDAP